MLEYVLEYATYHLIRFACLSIAPASDVWDISSDMLLCVIFIAAFTYTYIAFIIISFL